MAFVDANNCNRNSENKQLPQIENGKSSKVFKSSDDINIFNSS